MYICQPVALLIVIHFGLNALVELVVEVEGTRHGDAMGTPIGIRLASSGLLLEALFTAQMPNKSEPLGKYSICLIERLTKN